MAEWQGKRTINIMAREFDELNEVGKQRSLPFDVFFGEIEGLTEKEKKERIELAEKFEILLLYFFVVFLDEAITMDYEQMVYEKYVEIADEFLNLKQPSAYIDEYARQYAYDLVRATKEHEGDIYYVSKDRAVLNAEEQAFAVGEYRDNVRAIKSGKKRKSWLSMRDSVVRKTHIHADGQTVGIFEPFKVGNSLMMFPRDKVTHNAEDKEIIGCRCHAIYF